MEKIAVRLLGERAEKAEQGVCGFCAKHGGAVILRVDALPRGVFHKQCRAEALGYALNGFINAVGTCKSMFFYDGLQRIERACRHGKLKLKHGV